jgi:Protein of unknown function (DUF2892)
MIRNMSNSDRIIRVLLAALLAFLFFSDILTGIIGIAAVIFAAVFIFTSLLGFCPLYAPFKYSTYKNKP